MKYSVYLTSALALVLGLPAVAQPADPEEMIVVASRVERPLGQTLASVEVIGSQEIATSQAQDLLDLLGGRAGISLARDGGMGKNTSLFMRGTDSDHVLIYVDNQPVNGLSDGRARLDHLPLSQFERVEIVRGPRSSLYGSEAVGGVVRLFTRGADVTRGADEKPWGGNITASGGRYGYQAYGMNGYAGLGSTRLSGGYSQVQTDGFDARVAGNPDKDGYENRSWHLGVSQPFGNGHELSLRHSRTDSDSDYDDASWTDGVDGNEIYQRLNTAVDIRLQLSDRWNSQLSLGRFKDASDSTGVFGPFISTSRRDSARWVNEYEAAAGWVGVVGVDYDNDSYRSNFLATQEDRDNLALFGLLGWGTDRLPVELSLRNDWNEQYGSHTTGNLSLGWNTDAAGKLWLSYGTAFKAPNFFDLYGFGGDPDLEPERSRTLELGWRYLAESLRLSAALFRTRTDSLIEFDNLMFQIFNIGNIRIYGLELSASGELAGFSLGANFTHLQHENLDTGEALLRRPQNTWRLDAGRSYGDLYLGMVATAQTGRSDINNARLSGYQLLDLLVSYQLLENLVLRGKVANLFDRDYQLVDGFNTPGRNLQASLTYNF